ncbi:MAG TPA: ABC-2 family transporter protein [Candidatus Paceibacterota bacterium]|nr:ABC-2 family transporter protein [Candidatus Paceibacterota bacterium]
MKELRFAIYSIKKNLESSAELRTSFVTNVIGMAINNTAFIIIWIFFVKSVGVVNGWTALDIIALLGFNALAYGIVFSGGAGILWLPDYVASGGFDRYLLSPKNVLLRLCTSRFGVSSLGDVAFGVICLATYGILIRANLLQIALVILLIPIASLMLFAASVAAQSASFLFTDPGSVTRGLLELFITPGLFHGGAFQGATRFVFTFLVPSLVVGALPVEIVRDVSFPKLVLVAGVSAIWFLLSLSLFRLGIRKYESSNLMTFGS